MVYTTSYYAVYALTKAVLKLKDLLEARREAEEKRAERRRGRADLFVVHEPGGYSLVMRNEYRVKLPLISNPVRGLVPVYRIERGEGVEGGGLAGRRMYFSYTEVASDDWFSEVERLAKELEKRERGEK